MYLVGRGTDPIIKCVDCNIIFQFGLLMHLLKALFNENKIYYNLRDKEIGSYI